MKTYHRWEDLPHKASPEERAAIRAAARAELERIGFGALRKAQQQTQVELARTLGLPQASISDIENRSDLLLSTLARYIRALGGELQLNAVFPKATFNLLPPEDARLEMEKVYPKPNAKSKPKPARKAEAKPKLQSKRALAKAA
jgi:transcriptional regulator with XRE-family HTH domain